MGRSPALTILAVATTLVLWASAFVGIRAGLVGYSPGALALLRYLVASAVLGAVWMARGARFPHRRDWPLIGVAGALGFTFYNLALNAGETRVTAGAASFVGNTSPVLSALLATLLLGERQAPAGWAGILLSLCGTGLIAMGEGGGFRLEAGVLLVLLAACAQATYFTLQKPLLGRYEPLPLTAVALWAGTAALLPFLPALLAELPRAPLPATLAAVYLGVFPAAIGYVTWSYVLARLPVARTASFLYLVPILATAISWLWLHETPSALSLAGGAVSLAGVVLVNLEGRLDRAPRGAYCQPCEQTEHYNSREPFSCERSGFDPRGVRPRSGAAGPL